MASYNKFNQFVEDLADGVYNCSTNTFKVFMCTAANAPVATNSVLADLTEISYTNVDTQTLTNSTHGQSSGIYTQLWADLTITATGGAIATFRYIGVYSDTPISPADPLVGWYDYGSDLTLAENESITLNWTTSSFTLA